MLKINKNNIEVETKIFINEELIFNVTYKYERERVQVYMDQSWKILLRKDENVTVICLNSVDLIEKGDVQKC